jgi:hypothetical protein
MAGRPPNVSARMDCSSVVSGTVNRASPGQVVPWLPRATFTARSGRGRSEEAIVGVFFILRLLIAGKIAD